MITNTAPGPGREARGLGWVRDYPDVRDYTTSSEQVKPLLAKSDVNGGAQASEVSSVDLREWCSPVEDQGRIGSCTAHAGVGLLEYFERKAHGKHIDGSRRFLYKVTRQLAHLEGDTGAYLRSTIGAMALFGVPPEEFWPYDEQSYDEEPPPFCYALGQSYQALTYYRLDPPGEGAVEALSEIKSHLASKLPAMFGFTVYDCISEAADDGLIPFPAPDNTVQGGHAVVAVGYDDSVDIPNPSDGSKTTGALLIRNSWSAGWGEDGYGWLPYEYVVRGLATDWWVMVTSEWLDTGEFKT